MKIHCGDILQTKCWAITFSPQPHFPSKFQDPRWEAFLLWESWACRWVFLMRVSTGEGFLTRQTWERWPGTSVSELPFMSPSPPKCQWLSIQYKCGREGTRPLQPMWWETWHLMHSAVFPVSGHGWYRARDKGLASVFTSTSQFMKGYNPHISLVTQKNPEKYFQMGNPNFRDDRWLVQVHTA